MIKVCIVGAGAIGGFIGTRLAAARRAQVSAIARGTTLQALQRHGWRSESAAGLLQAPALATCDPGDVGPQDVVILAVKGPALTLAAQRLGPLLGPETIVMPAMNGVPWWLGQNVPALADSPLESVDPGGQVAAIIATERVIGCVVHASTSMTAPGLVRHLFGQGLIIGEARGGCSERVKVLEDLLSHAGFDVTPSDNIRQDIWYKLWGNLTMNPVSAITGATIDRVLADPLVRQFCSAAMSEAAAIGSRIGCVIEQRPEDRHAVTARLGAFKTSMLQDAEAGRPIELDSIVSAVHEIGTRLGQPTPHIGALLGLARLFGRVHGLYPSI